MNKILHNLPYNDSAHSIVSLKYLLIVLWAVTMAPFSAAISATSPVCPDPVNKKVTPHPDYAIVGDMPNVTTWQELPSLPANCHVPLQSPAKLVVAIAGQFIHAESVDEIARRLGAISETQGLAYWSVISRKWVTLVSKAHALEADNNKAARKDFDSQEVLSGQSLYSAQSDTYSWGLNRYGNRTISWSDNHLIFKNRNTTPIRLGPLTLFKAGSVQTVMFFTRDSDTRWQLYSLSVITKSMFGAKVRAFINSQGSIYRHLTGIDPKTEPPLAR